MILALSLSTSMKLYIFVLRILLLCISPNSRAVSYSVAISLHSCSFPMIVFLPLLTNIRKRKVALHKPVLNFRSLVFPYAS